MDPNKTALAIEIKGMARLSREITSQVSATFRFATMESVLRFFKKIPSSTIEYMNGEYIYIYDDQFENSCFIIFCRTQTVLKQNDEGCRKRLHAEDRGCGTQLTDDIDGGFPVAEPSGGSLGEINTVRQVIGPSQRRNPVVIAVVHQGVSKNEVTGNLRCSLDQAQSRYHHCTHHAPVVLLNSTRHFFRVKP